MTPSRPDNRLPTLIIYLLLISPLGLGQLHPLEPALEMINPPILVLLVAVASAADDQNQGADSEEHPEQYPENVSEPEGISRLALLQGLLADGGKLIVELVATAKGGTLGPVRIE